MKRLFILFFMMVNFTVIIFAQNITWNKSVGLNIGYSHVYNIDKFEYGDEPRNLCQMDINLYGIYCGIGFGFHNYTDYYESYYNGYYKEYYQLATYNVKFGPSIKIGSLYSNHRCILTPYIGVLLHSDGNHSYEYYTGYYDYYYGYIPGEGYDYGRNHIYEKKFVFGGKVSYSYKCFEIGAHVSNYDVGLTLGFNFNLDNY